MSNESRIIKEEYKIWRRNAPLLYDVALSHALEWPSLTVQWLPELKKSAVDDMETHHLMLGTHTSDGVQNYLMKMAVDLPRFLSTNNKEEIPNGGGKMTKERNKMSSPHSQQQKKAQGNAEVKIKILHDGEINRCRYMPQNHFVVATKSPSSRVFIFDISKHPSKPSLSNGFCPDHICLGHAREGYGLAWNPHKAGILLSGSDDMNICVWDINGAKSNKIQYLRIYSGHSSVVEDVAWHCGTPYIFGSVGDDKRILIWDTRNASPKGAASIQVLNAHEKDINSLAFHPTHNFILATASSDQSIKLWDIRNMSNAIVSLQGHQSDIYQLQWNPTFPSLLSSCGADRRVIISDISRLGTTQQQTPLQSSQQTNYTEQQSSQSRPETFFVHGGHTGKVSEHSWSSSCANLVASVAEDNHLQIWQPARSIDY